MCGGTRNGGSAGDYAAVMQTAKRSLHLQCSRVRMHSLRRNPAAPTILAPGVVPVTPAHSAEATADAQKATEEFMKKKLEAERMETQPAQSAPKEEDSSYIFPTGYDARFRQKSRCRRGDRRAPDKRQAALWKH